ncbi:hypothetical protein CLV28_0529 [Sediminihabitans luteus]|uniref:DUF3093 family protein n=1 Tax=Sediminihabitans luteus TaxID=1138585 RepID=A0A2M9CZH5_9CELL|nr:hypothetical protein [Sediminihabitans luteus]PJJ77310.1 hypothetical protein CLV28_0529 [Sediminihabitans luteus]GII98761.1 hypothetical protein Slu03_11390 [Sediminihabitans luteus]
MTSARPSDGRPDVGAAVLPYVETGGGYGRALRWVLVPAALGFVVDTAVRGWWDALVWPMVALVVGPIVLLTVWSTRRYEKVVVDRAGLTAGRERFPASAIDPVVVDHVAAHGMLAPGQLLPDGSTVTDGRLVGGAYAPTVGAGVLRLRLTDGTWIRVQCSAPPRVVAALQACLAGGDAHRA